MDTVENVETPDNAPDDAPVADQADLDKLATEIEAVLFASDSALNPAKIGKAVGVTSKRLVAQAVDTLNARYDRTGSAFRVETIAGGYQMLTRPEYHEVVKQFYHQKADTKLTQPAMETLAIIAYRQPIIRADVESIRGVACGEVLRGLMDRQLVRIVGRAEVLGRPMLYGTTRRFLEIFGLKDIQDLPNIEELRGGATPAAAAPGTAKPSEAGTLPLPEPPAASDAPPPVCETAAPEPVESAPSPEENSPAPEEPETT